MRETGHQEELQSTAEIVLAWGKGLEREKDYYLAWIVQAITQGETLQQALKCLITRLLLRNRTFESLKFSSFLFSKFLFFYGGFSYLIPSGMTIFLPVSPSTSRTNGKSDSKLLTVKRRFTKEVMRRWKKTNTLETNLFRDKKILDFTAIKRIVTQRYSAATERRCYVTVHIKAAKNSVLYSSQQKRCKPDQNRCQYVHHRWPGTTVFVWRPMELC